MNIKNETTSLFASKNDVTSSVSSHHNVSDFSLFENELNNTGQNQSISDTKTSNDLLNNVAKIFNNESQKFSIMTESLKKASKSINPIDINRVNKAMSDYYIQNMLNTKVISKSIQGLDKLTNLE